MQQMVLTSFSSMDVAHYFCIFSFHWKEDTKLQDYEIRFETLRAIKYRIHNTQIKLCILHFHNNVIKWENKMILHSNVHILLRSVIKSIAWANDSLGSSNIIWWIALSFTKSLFMYIRDACQLILTYVYYKTCASILFFYISICYANDKLYSKYQNKTHVIKPTCYVSYD